MASSHINVKEDGVVVISPAGFSGISYSDNIYYALNDENEYYNNLRGYDEDWNDVMKTVKIDPTASGADGTGTPHYPRFVGGAGFFVLSGV